MNFLSRGGMLYINYMRSNLFSTADECHSTGNNTVCCIKHYKGSAASRHVSHACAVH